MVTAVFCDVTGSTALGQRLDPEAMRELMETYFATVSAALIRHGGTVEKFVGDAVMAVFGVPVAHEDDALRACRAALEVLSAVADADRGTDAEHRVPLMVRVGVETGEVVVGDPRRGSSFASGAAVNMAARLEQAAEPGQCLLGPANHRLVRDLVEVQTKNGLSLKGFSAPVTAYRLLGLSVNAGPVTGRPVAPLVGRDRELVLLRQAYDRAVGDRTCQLVTVLGAAGAGKSRLAAEFLEGLTDHDGDAGDGGALVLRGRCLSYGEGVTYWPLVEVVRQAVGLTGAESEELARSQLALLLAEDPDVRQVVELVAPVAGLGGVPGTVEDTAWAVQRLLDALATQRPVVLVVDDLHWAEPGLRAVIDAITDWSRDAPILLLVLARPELLDDVADWGAGKTNAVTALLPPLRDAEVDTLMTQLLPDKQLPAGLPARIREAAGGNPLFVEQLLAMLGDDRQLDQEDMGDLQIPPTIVALLTARLDQLPEVERAVLGAASVIGQTFYQAAVLELSEQPSAGVTRAVKALLRKGLVRPDRSDLPGQHAMRFDHVLVQDVAYHGLSKRERARLHERFARWLDKHAEGQAYDDFIGSHLEAAYRNRADLGPPDDSTRLLGEEAAARLATAGDLLLVVDDNAAIALLTRALAPLPQVGPARWAIEYDLADALLRVGPLDQATELAETMRAAAEAAGDLQWVTRGRLLLAQARQFTAPEGASELLEHEAQDALTVFEQFGDELGLGTAHQCLGSVANVATDISTMMSEFALAGAHMALAGRSQLAEQFRYDMPLWGMMIGDTTASTGITRARLRMTTANARTSHMNASSAVFFFASLLGLTEEARQARARAEQLQAELGNAETAQFLIGTIGGVALVCGNAVEAAELLDRACTIDEAFGDAASLSTDAALHSHALALTLDYAGARHEADRALRSGSTDDVLTQGLARSALAWLTALDGEDPDGVRRQMTAALSFLEPTELLLSRALVHAACAEAAALLGDESAERHHRQSAIDLYDAKENVVGAARQRALLER